MNIFNKKEDEELEEESKTLSKIEELENASLEFQEAFENEIRIAKKLEEAVGTLKDDLNEARKQTTALRNKMDKIRKSLYF